MLLAIVFALVGNGVLKLPQHWTLNVAAALLFICAVLVALADQAGV